MGHIGSALAVSDLVALLYDRLLKGQGPDGDDRDRVVLSKGHAALALYAALRLTGYITQAELDTYCGDDSLLGVHPEHALIGVDLSTGSLSQGLSIAAGVRLLELASGAHNAFMSQGRDEKRKLLQLLVSNSSSKHGRLAVELHAPFDSILSEGHQGPRRGRGGPAGGSQ